MLTIRTDCWGYSGLRITRVVVGRSVVSLVLIDGLQQSLAWPPKTLS